MAQEQREKEKSTHMHKCSCGQVWEHGDECTNKVKAHTCTNCGEEVWVKHRPDGDPFLEDLAKTLMKFLDRISSEDS